jgi:hypothetical protein
VKPFAALEAAKLVSFIENPYEKAVLLRYFKSFNTKIESPSTLDKKISAVLDGVGHLEIGMKIAS